MKQLKIAVFIITVFVVQKTNAQWTVGGITLNRHGSAAQLIGAGNNTWRSWGFGDFTGTNTPLARVHINEFLCLPTSNFTNGNLFRTDGSNTVSNNWRLYTGDSQGTSNEKFRITSLANSNDIELGSVQSGTLNFITNNTQRVTILGNAATPFNRNGFVGLNNNNPLFHLDINTQNPGGTTFGELLFRAKIADDPNAYISFVNIATTGSLFVPTLLARQSNNPSSALSTVGSINSVQDLSTGAPVTRFYSVTNYDPTVPTLAFSRVNAIINRKIFAWNNSIDELMTMEANGFLGVATPNPGNRVEINSDFYGTGGLPTGSGGGPIITDLSSNGNIGSGSNPATGFSGLRFTDLTSSSNPILSNPGLGVLSVDENGDVIYVEINSNTNNGFVDCADTSPAANLSADSKVNLNNNNLYFENNDLNNVNHVGFGYNCYQALPGKVSALQTHTSTVGSSTVTFYGENSDITNTAGTDHIVFNGLSNGVQPNGVFTQNIGANLEATNSGNNIGVMGYANGTSVTTSNNTAGAFRAVNGTNGMGVRASSTSSSITNYGILASGFGGDVSYGIYASATGASTTNYAGYFNGDVYVNGGTNSGTGYLVASDAQFKNDVNDLNGALDIVNQLQPKTYFLDTLNAYNIQFSNKRQYGLIAQDVELILPELVGEITKPNDYDSVGNIITPSITYKNLNYTSLIPVLIAGMKEQQTQLDAAENHSDSLENVVTDLNNRLSQLESCLSGILPLLCQLNNSAIAPTQEEVQRELAKAIDVQLSDRNNIVLNQNVPNPFAEKTVISYSIPETVGKAQIHFYDGKGTLINSVDIDDRGRGEINVYANDLSSGIYTYSLVADGQIVSTKRMMKQ